MKTTTALLLLLPMLSNCFVPHPSSKLQQKTRTVHQMNPFWIAEGDTTAMVDAVTDAASDVATAVAPIQDAVVSAGDGGGGGGIFGIIQNIAVGITAILFLLAGITYVTAAVIVPAAAKELEQECKELAPELWNEYQAKLEPGQTIAERPDLMQELGAKLQPMLDAKMAKQFAEQREQGLDPTKEEMAWKALDDLPPMPSASSSKPEEQSPAVPGIEMMSSGQWDDDDDIVDAKIISEEKKDDTNKKA